MKQIDRDIIQILYILKEMYEYLEEVDEEERGCNEGALQMMIINKYYSQLEYVIKKYEK